MKYTEQLKIKKQNNLFKKAMRLNCKDCMGGSTKMDCKMDTCTLYSLKPLFKQGYRG